MYVVCFLSTFYIMRICVIRMYSTFITYVSNVVKRCQETDVFTDNFTSEIKRKKHVNIRIKEILFNVWRIVWS